MSEINFKNKISRPHSQGFSLLELILTIAIFSVASIATGYLIIDAGKTTEVNSKKIGAILLAKEGLEAVRSIRDTDGFSALTALDGTDNGLSFDSGANLWSFSGSSDVSADNVYTRVISIDQIATHTVQVISSVTATSGPRTISTSLTTQFTDWR